MVMIGVAVLLAITFVPAPWGIVLVVGAIAWEIVGMAFWVRYSKRIPIVAGREAMIGLPVTVITPCQPEGRVQLRGERWKARCAAGAGVGETLVIEAVEQITLVISNSGPDPH